LDEAGLREELKSSAEARLRRSLILFQVAREENVQVNEQEVQEEAIRMLNSISQSYTEKEARKMINEDFIQNMIGNITSEMLVSNTLERLSRIARGESEVVEEVSEDETAPAETAEESAAAETE
jgi:trigger factor